MGPSSEGHLRGVSTLWSAQLPTPNGAWLSLHRCWDINANASVWWVIRGPVILSILVSGHSPLSWAPVRETRQRLAYSDRGDRASTPPTRRGTNKPQSFQRLISSMRGWKFHPQRMVDGSGVRNRQEVQELTSFTFVPD